MSDPINETVVSEQKAIDVAYWSLFSVVKEHGLYKTLRALERLFLVRAFEAFGSKTDSAKALGLQRTTFVEKYRRVVASKKYEI